MHIRRNEYALFSLSEGVGVWRVYAYEFQDAYPSSVTLTLSLVLRIVGKRAYLCHIVPLISPPVQPSTTLCPKKRVQQISMLCIVWLHVSLKKLQFMAVEW